MKLLHQGSSKDLFELDDKNQDILLLKFSDRVSVFDYGALPDLIPGKARACAAFAKMLFHELSGRGISCANLNIEQFHIDDLDVCLLMKRAQHPLLGETASVLKFLPVEVVFRFGAPEGSSLLKRDSLLRPWQKFTEPRLEFFTKLESTDRLLETAEAVELIGGQEKFEALHQFGVQSALALQDIFKKIGLFLWDGKIECAWNETTRSMTMVDALTPDELRLSIPGLEKIPLSKELLRQWLGSTLWSHELRIAKESYGATKEWKKHIPYPVPKLGSWRIQKLSSMYESLTEALKANSSRPILDWIRTDLHKPSVFIPGQGGRETSLRWRLEREGSDIAKAEDTADSILVSQDAQLSQGLVNDYLKVGLWVVGPTAQAAQIEWSKEFGRIIAKEAKLSIPQFTIVQTVKDLDWTMFSKPPVVKWDGLAAGKGVLVSENWDQVKAFALEGLQKGKILLEERLQGFEASAFFAVTPGFGKTKIDFLGTAKDFKRRFAHDEGPNTGGMGAYAPHPDITPTDIELFSDWAARTVHALEARGIPYQGILYLGLMKDSLNGWTLIEYNARFGDPETQALVCSWHNDRPYLRSLLQLSLQNPYPMISEQTALCLALVRSEYPQKVDPFKTPLPQWEPTQKQFQLFYSGSTTGRVAYLVGCGRDIMDAGDRVFEQLVESPWKELLEWRADILP